ncbi:MAG TPA: hypothetical protein VGM20_10030 [Gemmatimonadales bacterium]|jgi:protein-S-isoprenylcysteine O-methyltransferase Ste14
MRFIKPLLTSLGLLMITGVNAVALAAQDPAVKVNVKTDATDTTWYTTPAAIAIGCLIVLLIIVLTVLAARRKGGGSTTTVIR